MVNYQEKLMSYSANGPSNMINFCLAKGADVNKEDDKGVTPLIAAADAGQVEAIRILIEKGADVNYRNKSSLSAIGAACKNFHWEIACLLLEEGAELSEQKGELLLSLACQHGDISKVKTLLEQGVSPHAKDISGRSALMRARSGKAWNIVYLLLENGVSINVEPKVDLAKALASGQDLDLLLTLLKRIEDEQEFRTVVKSVLFSACSEGSVNIVNFLFKKVSQFGDYEPFKCLRLALEGENWPIAYFLETHGAEFELHVGESGETITVVDWEINATLGKAWVEYTGQGQKRIMGQCQWVYQSAFDELCI